MHRAVMLAVAVCLAVAPARGQFVDAPAEGDAAPRLGDVRSQHYRVGLVITAANGACRGIYATVPVPADWPEQKVHVVSEDVSPAVGKVSYRTLECGVKQMVVEIPDLAAGTQARAIVTFEVRRAAILAPAATDGLRIPAKPDRELRAALASGIFVETRNPRIAKFAKAAGQDLDGWKKVRSIYDAVRDKADYRHCDAKGAARTLTDGFGDAEDLACLFIAACRAEGIPARTVWVEGHCYPEFWLENEAGAGHWYPCQAAGAEAFGAMPDQLPILEKGDDFRDPDRPGKSLRYVTEFLRGSPVPGSGPPRVEWVREGA